MPEYDFRTLSSYDFEILVRDLLQAEMKVRVESFRQGKDQGVDLRYAASPQAGFIAQCKHYGGSGFAKLASHLAASEKPKIVRLAPTRYLLVTSVSLNKREKDELLRVLHPFCHGPQDIYGKEDLNNILGQHPEIERQHFKLWLSSTAVLDRLLNSRIYTQTELALDAIQEKMCRYVQNESYPEALAMLNDLHYCIICGMPGIGKTMLADMLLVSLIGSGYEAVKISGSVDEALSLFKKGKRQVFYYDDFLGQTSLQQQKLAKNEDQQLLMLIDRMRESERHRFLLTTREYILAQAKTHYERLETSRFDVRKCVITLDKYTLRNRCKILFNHLYFSRLPRQHVEALVASGAHRSIVKHRNFNPRIIEWMTAILTELPPAAEYGKEFIKNLDQPQRLWDHAYSRQLSAPAQVLLLVLGVVGGEVFVADAERAFEAAWSPRSKDPLADVGVKPFMSALRELDGTFVRSTKDAKGNIVLAFQSPSIRDFVEYKLRLDGVAARSLLERAVFFEQPRHLDDTMGSSPAMEGLFANEWVDELCKVFARTLGEPGCTVKQIRWYQGALEFSHADYTIEERVGFVLQAVEDAPGEIVGRHVDELLGRLLVKWQEHGVAAEQIEDLLDAVEGSPHVRAERKREVSERCAAALLEAEGEVAVFRAYGELYRAKKIPPTEESLERMREQFFKSLHWMLDVSDYSDSYSARDAIIEVEDVGKALGVDIEDELERAREEAASIRDPEDDPADEAPAPRRSETVAEVLSDQEIDDMFSAL